MTDLDTRLRALARDSLERAAADTAVEEDLAAVRARVGVPPLRTAEPARSRARQRLAVAAGIALLVGGAIAVLATRGGEDELVAPVTVPVTQPTPTVTPTSAPTSASTSPPMTTVGVPVTTTGPVGGAASLAAADPSRVGAGWTVTITPAGEVRRTCQDIVSVAAETADGLVHRGLILADGWDTSTPPTIPACDGQRTDAPLEVRVPTGLERGGYRFCIAGEDVPEGCARVEVPGVVPTTTVPSTTTTTSLVSPSTDTLPIGYFERVYVEDPPYFELREMAADGTIVGEVGEGSIAQLLRREIPLDEGTIRLLEQEEPYGRCDDRDVATTGPAPDVDAVGRVRSLAATTDGVVIAGVDVCPDGAQWGDAGTHFELRRIDLRDGTTTVLHVREPGDGDTFFEDPNVVYAGGELIAESVSTDGAFVAVAEPYTTENTRYHVIDATAGGEPIELASSCDDPGDLVGPPQFVGDGLVVLARECSPVDVEIGDLVVELVSLTTREPVWSVVVGHVAIDSYSHTVALSATAVGGQVWALVSASPGVEQPTTAAAVTAGGEQPLPVESNVAFTPQELIYTWDPYAP